MARARSRVTDYLIYLIVRLFVCLVQALPPAGARAFARGLAWLAYHVNRRHREVAHDNLRHAFPGRYTEPELDALVRAVYRHFCTLMVEMILIPRLLQPTNWRRYITLVNGDVLTGCLLSGRPLLVVTGHWGNWEMAGYALGLLGFTTHAIARALDNPYLERFLLKFREKTGQKILAKHGDFANMQALLDGGGVLATLADQDAGPRGLFVDFFGRPASTHKAVALMALQHQVVLLVAGTRKVGEPMRYEVVAQDIIYPEEYAGHADPVRAITQRFTTALEQLIRTAPEQYFWLHRRWKHQPQERARKKAA
jgi:KDO2-lipid IV(A) lauroyltransferase